MKDGGPAFPHGHLGDSMQGEDGRIWHQYPAGTGMTLRDWFAGQALAGQLAGLAGATTNMVALPLEEAPKALAESAYNIADAMIAAREGGAK